MLKTSQCKCGQTDPKVMEYAGFKKDFTMHQWCERFYVGIVRKNGTIKPCPCKGHQEK